MVKKDIIVRIFHCVDWSVPFVYLSIGYAIKNLPSYLKDCEVTLWDYKDFKNHNIEKYNDECILIFEAGNIPHGNWTVSQLKGWFPKCKIISLASDTIWWMHHGGQQIPDQHLIDLNLELIPQAIDWMSRKGWTTDQWLWTCSDLNIAELKLICNQDKIDWQRKRIDTIGVYGPWTIEQPGYRHNMVKWLKENNVSFTQGANNSGHQDKDISIVYNSYMDSWLNIGTTSHGSVEFNHLGCLKGWREWISPFLNCLLIHDGHPNVQNAYNKDNILPTYRFGDFNQIKDLVYFYKNNISIYREKLELQRKWATENTLDRQLVKLMLKYNFIKEDDVLRNG